MSWKSTAAMACRPRRYDAMLDMLAAGKITPQKLIGRRISLEEAVPALMTLDKAEGKGISVITRF